jgi:hypothetical protein
MKQNDEFSFQLTEKSDEKESSIEFSGTFSVLGIALIVFGFGYAIANSKKRLFNQ